MTPLTEHPKVGPLLERARLTYKDGSKTSGMFFDDESIAALLAAILAAVGEGEEGLDISAGHDALASEGYDCLCEALDRQHRARVGALKQRIAELERERNDIIRIIP